MSLHMHLCTTCCTERWLWSPMLSMDYRQGFIPSPMRGFEGFLLQGIPEFPWGYVPRIVHRLVSRWSSRTSPFALWVMDNRAGTGVIPGLGLKAGLGVLRVVRRIPQHQVWRKAKLQSCFVSSRPVGAVQHRTAFELILCPLLVLCPSFVTLLRRPLLSSLWQTSVAILAL